MCAHPHLRRDLLLLRLRLLRRFFAGERERDTDREADRARLPLLRTGDLDTDFDFDRPLAGDLEREADRAPPALMLLLRERAAAAACGGERDLLGLRRPAGLRLRLALRCRPLAAAAALRGLRLRPLDGLRLRERSLHGTARTAQTQQAAG
jgi:hypothetical protein